MNFLRAVTLALIALAATGSSAFAQLRVVATTPDLASLAREIGGNRVSVVALAKPTEDPHFVDAKPSHIVTLNRADALIEGGAELELGWLPPLLENSRNSKISAGAPGRIVASVDRYGGGLSAAMQVVLVLSAIVVLIGTVLLANGVVGLLPQARPAIRPATGHAGPTMETSKVIRNAGTMIAKGIVADPLSSLAACRKNCRSVFIGFPILVRQPQLVDRRSNRGKHRRDA